MEGFIKTLSRISRLPSLWTKSFCPPTEVCRPTPWRRNWRWSWGWWSTRTPSYSPAMWTVFGSGSIGWTGITKSDLRTHIRGELKCQDADWSNAFEFPSLSLSRLLSVARRLRRSSPASEAEASFRLIKAASAGRRLQPRQRRRLRWRRSRRSGAVGRRRRPRPW